MLRSILDKVEPLFEKGGKFARIYPLFEAGDTFMYTPSQTTSGTTHVRDGINLKRMMMTVIAALVPCVLMAMYNTGLQSHLAIQAGALPLDNWQTSLFQALGFAFDPSNLVACAIHGALYFIPVWLVTLATGGLWEALFAVVRGHEITEGFLVTWFLIPLILPPTIPLWQVVVGTSFGIVVGKEIFGGVGRNIFNPALTVRIFLFFAYPAAISGDQVWIAANTAANDAYSGATWLARSAVEGPAAFAQANWWDAFWGFIPGSMGETSFAACMLGAALLIITRIASLRTMLGFVLGSLLMTLLLNSIGSTTNPMFNVAFHWHIVLGGWAFALVYMATEPVTSPHSEGAKFIYGLAIGVLGILVRVLNPAYPEGWMLAILFMNMFAPFIDYFYVRANIARRAARYAA